jgi:maleamate amidohydrolase
MPRIWERFLTERDKQVFAASGYGARQGFGRRPALLIIDVSYGFTGDVREPVMTSIERWPNSCGEDAWDAVPVIKSVATAFRAKNLPVIYTTGVARPDNWDAGSWSWKNARTQEWTTGADRRIDPNDIVADIAPEPQDLVVLKQKPSGFHASNLLSYLVLLGCDSLVVTGTSTSGCVRATVVDAFSFNYRVSVVEDGCFDRCEASHAISLADMNAKYADVVSSHEALEFVAGLNNDLFDNLPKRSPTSA